jgi:hypothetical protein
MSDALFQRSLDASHEIAAERPLPRGFGLLFGAAVSVLMWAGLIWAAIRLFA